ncbi:hypothetical protein [Leptospira kirschneri]
MPILREVFAELPGSLCRSRWKLNTTLSYGARCGADLFTEDLS